MKKITIGLFSLFALSFSVSALACTPRPNNISSCTSAPESIKPFWQWLAETIIGVVVKWAEWNIEHGNWIVAPSPGGPTQTANVNFSVLINDGEMVGQSDDHASLTRNLLLLNGDLVIQNNEQAVIVLKAGTYRIANNGDCTVKLDIFKPTSKFPNPPGDFI